VVRTNSCQTATHHYYFQPSTAFFRSFELDVYASAGIHFQHPTLDLGCGDGIFAHMLQDAGILDSTDLAIDYSFDKLSQVHGKKPRSKLFQADVRALPFKSNQFSSIVSNGVICCINSDNEAAVNQAFAEAHRVLNDEGTFILTTFTSQFERNLLVPKILRSLGMCQLASKYVTRMTRGLGHYQVFDAETWIKKLQDCHFDIRQVHYYFSPYQGLWWNFFTLPPVSFWFKRLKNRRLRLLRYFSTFLLARFFELILRTRRNPDTIPETAGYVLIAAQKGLPH
jgi:SAM-dependent methyltransferase